MTRKPTSARARDLHGKHPGWTAQQIATALGTSRQAVQSALRARHSRPGKPVDLSARVARLKRELAAAERELAESAR
jgi:hypothetical protein